LTKAAISYNYTWFLLDIKLVFWRMFSYSKSSCILNLLHARTCKRN